MESTLKSTESDLRSAIEKREDHSEESRSLHYEIESLKSQLKEEKSAHKATQDKLDSLKTQVNEFKQNKVYIFPFFFS